METGEFRYDTVEMNMIEDSILENPLVDYSIPDEPHDFLMIDHSTTTDNISECIVLINEMESDNDEEVIQNEEKAAPLNRLPSEDTSSTKSDTIEHNLVGPFQDITIEEEQEDDEEIRLIEPKTDSNSGSSSEEFSPSCTSSSSTTSSNSNPSSPNDSEKGSIRLNPLKIMLSLGLNNSDSDTSTNSETSLEESVEGVIRKRRMKRTSGPSKPDEFVPSSDNSLSSYSGGSSPNELDGSSSKESSTDVESGGVKDVREKGVSGVVSFLGLGRFWFNSSRFDARAEKKKLNEADKKKTTVVEIYPWIQEEEKRAKKEAKQQIMLHRQTHRHTDNTVHDDTIAVRQC